MSNVTSGVYTSIYPHQRKPARRPWHDERAQRPIIGTANKTTPTLPEPGLRVQRAKVPTVREPADTALHPRWADILAVLEGRPDAISITTPIHGSSQAISEAIDRMHQQSMVIASSAPPRSEFMTKLDTALAEGKARTKAADRGCDVIVASGPYCLLLAKPQPRIWTR